MNTLSLWPTLHKIALLGTTRAGEMLALPEDAPAALHEALAQDREGALLSLLAAASLGRRAGMLSPSPKASDASTGVCPDEPRPIAPSAACSRLRGLSGGESALLSEWLGLARAHQVLAPHDALPALLILGARSRDLRPALLPVLGERGRWLAAQNPDWKWARGEMLDNEADADEAERIFRDGEGEARATAFARLRALDAARGLQVLEGVWKGEAAEKKRGWIEVLRAELSPEDEAFLERALDDRSQAVCLAAAETLVALPDSAFAQRAAERAGKYLRGERKEGVLQIEVDLPVAWDASWARDGLEEKGALHGQVAAQATGQRTWWLVQMLAFTPPSHWPEAWHSEPSAIVDALERADAALLEGLHIAAVRMRESDWLQAVLCVCGPSQSMSTIISALAPGERDELLAGVVRHVQESSDSEATTVALNILHAHHEPWGRELSREVIAWMQAVAARIAEEAKPQNFNLRATPGGPLLLYVHQFTARMDLGGLAHARDGWPDEPNHPAIQIARDHLIASFEARTQMHREFEV